MELTTWAMFSCAFVAVALLVLIARDIRQIRRMTDWQGERFVWRCLWPEASNGRTRAPLPPLPKIAELVSEIERKSELIDEIRREISESDADAEI